MGKFKPQYIWELIEGADPTNKDNYKNVEYWDTEAFGRQTAAWYKEQGITKPKVDVRMDRSVTSDGDYVWDSHGDIVEGPCGIQICIPDLEEVGDRIQNHLRKSGRPYQYNPETDSFTDLHFMPFDESKKNPVNDWRPAYIGFKIEKNKKLQNAP